MRPAQAFARYRTTRRARPRAASVVLRARPRVFAKRLGALVSVAVGHAFRSTSALRNRPIRALVLRRFPGAALLDFHALAFRLTRGGFALVPRLAPRARPRSSVRVPPVRPKTIGAGYGGLGAARCNEAGGCHASRRDPHFGAHPMHARRRCLPPSVTVMGASGISVASSVPARSPRGLRGDERAGAKAAKTGSAGAS